MVLNNLQEGTYIFQLTVMDAVEQQASTNITVTVLNAEQTIGESFQNAVPLLNNIILTIPSMKINNFCHFPLTIVFDQHCPYLRGKKLHLPIFASWSY